MLEPAADHVLVGQLLHAVAPAMGLYVLAGHRLKVRAAEKTAGLLPPAPSPPLLLVAAAGCVELGANRDRSDHSLPPDSIPAPQMPEPDWPADEGPPASSMAATCPERRFVLFVSALAFLSMAAGAVSLIAAAVVSLPWLSMAAGGGVIGHAAVAEPWLSMAGGGGAVSPIAAAAVVSLPSLSMADGGGVIGHAAAAVVSLIAAGGGVIGHVPWLSMADIAKP